MHESIRNLRLDRRLVRRRGWIAEDELARELAELPDVSDKAELVADREDEGGPARSDASEG